MSNSSFAAQMVANGPMTAAPPSFDGHGWLLVINLALMTATALLAIGKTGSLILAIAHEGKARGPLVLLMRWLFVIAFGGMAIRTGVEALSLWGWNPLDPARTGWYLTLKRALDPFGAAGYFAAICIFTMTEDAFTGALDRKPYPERLVTALPKLRKPTILAALALMTAIAVVSLR